MTKDLLPLVRIHLTLVKNRSHPRGQPRAAVAGNEDSAKASRRTRAKQQSQIFKAGHSALKSALWD